MNNDENIQNIASKAEAFLFAEGDTLSVNKLARLISCTNAELESALSVLRERLRGTGITLIETGKDVALAVSSETADAVKAATLREVEREIGEAGLEVLTILLYRGPSTRAEIDYIRGVNTSTTLRTLLIRGLVVRGTNPADAREYVYTPTTELLAHLGVTSAKQLPDYDTIASELASFERNQSPIEVAHGDTNATADPTRDE